MSWMARGRPSRISRPALRSVNLKRAGDQREHSQWPCASVRRYRNCRPGQSESVWSCPAPGAVAGRVDGRGYSARARRSRVSLVVGDWLNYGDAEYGEMYAQAAATTGLEYASLDHCKVVANSIEFGRRRPNLTWSHHHEVAGLEPDEQDLWLERAEANGWTVKELRASIKGTKPKPLPIHTPLLRFSQNLETPIIVAQILRVYFPDAETAFDSTGGDGGFWDGSEPVQGYRAVRRPSAQRRCGRLPPAGL